MKRQLQVWALKDHGTNNLNWGQHMRFWCLSHSKLRRLARAFAARIRKVWMKMETQTKYIPLVPLDTLDNSIGV